ncbi:MAG: plasmid stabilization protein [Deltaproteobacteria bacterium]|nr:plasmid stabilization protein [Deltaproteobacteria bacterium]
MPRGSKAAYTSKQRRQAKHIEDSVKKSGKSTKTAARIAYATVNKQDGGGKKSGSGRGKTRNTAPSRKGGRKGKSK